LSQKQTLCNTDISLLTNSSKFDIAGRIDKRRVYEIARPENSLSTFTLIQIAKNLQNEKMVMTFSFLFSSIVLVPPGSEGPRWAWLGGCGSTH